MEINFTLCSISRIIIHEIFKKAPGQDQATHSIANTLMEFSPEVEDLVKKRLNVSFGKESQSFSVGIENSSPNSFFSKSVSCGLGDDANFIARSSEMCTALADCLPHQTSGGYLIVLQGFYHSRFFISAIKADKTDALQTSGSSLQVLDDIFLSTSAKFFKIATISQLPGNNDPNQTSSYEALIFDEQFKSNVKLAQYFYSDFCGFEVDSNAKIRTREFYLESIKLINSCVTDFEEGERIKDQLLNEILHNNSLVISPADFGRNFLQGSFQEAFLEEIVTKYPQTFIKNSILFDRSVKHKNMFFNEVKLTGPTEIFNEAIEIIDSEQELSELHVGVDMPYTIVKIYGKPKHLKPKPVRRR